MRPENAITLVALLGIASGVAYWLHQRNVSDVTDAADSSDGADASSDVISDVEATVSGWKSVGNGPVWLPALNAAEQAHGLPVDLLARMAYQESHFREEIIRGTTPSPAGALGILQLIPRYFQSVNVPAPYSDDAVSAQIDEAATQVRNLYEQFGAWSLALAAYNAGAGNVRKYGGVPPFTETQNYVSQISADVPSLAVA